MKETLQGIPGVTFFEKTKPIHIVTRNSEDFSFRSERKQIGDLGIAYVTGENQGDFLIFDEDTPSLFIHENAVFKGRAEDMDPEDSPFFLTIYIEPAPNIPTECRFYYPKFNLNYTAIIEPGDEGVDDSWAMADYWRELYTDTEEVETKKEGYRLYTPPNGEILSDLYFSFHTQPQTF